MQIICRETIAYARELVFGDEWDGTSNADAEAVRLAMEIVLDMTWPVNSVRAIVLEKIPKDSVNAVIEQVVDLLMIAHVGDILTPGAWQRCQEALKWAGQALYEPNSRAILERHPAMRGIFRAVQVALAVNVPVGDIIDALAAGDGVYILNERGRLKRAKHPFKDGTQIEGNTPAAVGRAAAAHFGLDDFVAAHARAATTGLSRMIPATVNHMARCIGSWHTQDEVIAMGINDLPYVQYCTMDCAAFDERDYPTYIEIASSISYVAVASYKYCVERLSKDEVIAWINQNVTYHPEIVREEMLF